MLKPLSYNTAVVLVSQLVHVSVLSFVTSHGEGRNSTASIVGTTVLPPTTIITSTSHATIITPTAAITTATATVPTNATTTTESIATIPASYIP